MGHGWGMVAGENVLKKTKDSPVVLMRLHRLYILRFGGIKCKENANANLFNTHGAIYLIYIKNGADTYCWGKYLHT